MYEWISVGDTLPPIGERVLVYQEGGVYSGNEIDIDIRVNENYPEEVEANNRIVWDSQGIVNDIHFWMPLPKPPK